MSHITLDIWKTLGTNELTDLMRSLAEYGIKSGKYYHHPIKIYQELKSSDPFVVYRARLAAAFILKDSQLYH